MDRELRSSRLPPAPGTVQEPPVLEQAARAADAGRWREARDAFVAALEEEETGEARFGLAVAAWWLGDTGAAVADWQRAYAAFCRDEPARAVLVAFYLCLAYRMSLGNAAASGGWLARAASLVSEHGLDDMRGWVLLGRAYLATDTGDPRLGERHARAARALAQAADDADLRLCATSELGAALFEQGHVREGGALLDEAMAGALGGEGGDLDTVVLVSCRTVTSCSRGGDVSRVTQWVHAADEFHRTYGSPHLYATCRTHYGGVLFAGGRWTEAERELRAALDISREAEPALVAEALAVLAELRLAQGRPEEAARLVAGVDDHPAAARAVAAVRMAAGHPGPAAALLRRRLAEIDETSLGGTALAELLCEAELASGALAAARARAERLAALDSSDLLVARGARALARALIATGDTTGGAAHLERALAAYGRLGMPLEASRTRLLLARVLSEPDRATAIAEARAALASFEELGAARDADAAAGLLRTLGVRAARSGPRGTVGLTRREEEVLGLLGHGLSNRAIAERLVISRKTVEHHVASILAKLGVSGRGEAAAYALRRDGESATR